MELRLEKRSEILMAKMLAERWEILRVYVSCTYYSSVDTLRSVH